jgi:hypothetical protein
LRTKSKTTALKSLGVDLSSIQNTPVPKPQQEEPIVEFDPEEFAGKVCSLDNPDCLSCGS